MNKISLQAVTRKALRHEFFQFGPDGGQGLFRIADIKHRRFYRAIPGTGAVDNARNASPPTGGDAAVLQGRTSLFTEHLGVYCPYPQQTIQERRSPSHYFIGSGKALQVYALIQPA